MKTIISCLCCLLVLGVNAQTVINKTYPVKPGQKVELDFDYPKIVRISTWDKNEVSVKAMVSINDGENDSAFQLESRISEGAIHIENFIKDMKNLPKRYTVIEDGKKTTFRSRDEYSEFKRQLGMASKGRITSEGVDMEITIEIKVPANTVTNIDAKYGIVELVNFHAPATVSATYGGIDATVEPGSTGKLQATTHYGQIYTNLDLKLTSSANRDFYTSITAEPGKGPEYILKSTYGNLYLRKQ
jgi:hypothetical protein